MVSKTQQSPDKRTVVNSEQENMGSPMKKYDILDYQTVISKGGNTTQILDPYLEYSLDAMSKNSLD